MLNREAKIKTMAMMCVANNQLPTKGSELRTTKIAEVAAYLMEHGYTWDDLTQQYRKAGPDEIARVPISDEDAARPTLMGKWRKHQADRKRREELIEQERKKYYTHKYNVPCQEYLLMCSEEKEFGEDKALINARKRAIDSGGTWPRADRRPSLPPEREPTKGEKTWMCIVDICKFIVFGICGLIGIWGFILILPHLI